MVNMSLDYYTLQELENLAYHSDNKLALEIIERMQIILNRYFDDKKAFDKIVEKERIEREEELSPDEWYSKGAYVTKWFMERDPAELFNTERVFNGCKIYGSSDYDENTNPNNHHLRLERVGGERWKLTIHHSEYGEQLREEVLYAKTITTARKEAHKKIVELLTMGIVILDVA